MGAGQRLPVGRQVHRAEAALLHQRQAALSDRRPIDRGCEVLQRRESGEHPVGRIHHGSVWLIARPEPRDTRQKISEGFGGHDRMGSDREGQPFGGGAIVRPAEPPGAFRQPPGDQHIAVGRVVGVDRALAGRIPLPGREAVLADHQGPLGPAPHRLEPAGVSRLGGQQQPVALSLAVGNAAVAVVDDPALRGEEPRGVALPLGGEPGARDRVDQRLRLGSRHERRRLGFRLRGVAPHGRKPGRQSERKGSHRTPARRMAR